MSKQTVWLITMLSLMVVLSAYYIVTGPVEPVDEVASTEEGTKVTTNDTNPLELALFGSEEEDGEKKDSKEDTETSSKDGESEEGKEADEGAPTLGGEDYFFAMQAERSTINEQMIDKYTAIATDPESTPEQAKEAAAKLEELQKKIDQVTEMEELIRGQGYADALVSHDDGRYDITVQADKLSKKEAVGIIELIQDETNVPATYLTVSYHP